MWLQAKQKATDLQDSVSKILHIDHRLEQDHMEGVDHKEWVSFRAAAVAQLMQHSTNDPKFEGENLGN
jgi:hypothetical protein